MSQQPTSRKGSQVVHVRDGSDQAFEELFKVVINPPEEQTKPSSVPLRMRNLPASFFQQPDPQMNVEGDIPGYPSQPNTGMPIAHNRAHSSPASLQQTLTAAPPLPPQHLRQHSYDLVTEDALPPGWDTARTTHGQSHLSQTTTWQDPRKSVSTNNLNKQQQQQQQQQQSGQPPQPPGSPSQSQQAIDNTPLPQGWERAYTAEGEVYYINHINRTTSWFHPNIAPHLQRPGMRLQQQMGGQGPARLPPLIQRPLTPEEQQRQMKLQHLQREKEKLQQRQDEIARQEMLIRANLGNNDPNAAAVAAVSAAQQQQQPQQSQSQKIAQANEMTSIADPFLGQTATSDLHSRQESADSGLGGMGTSYSLPRTEDFLGMDEMDTQEGGPKLPGQGDFGGMDMTPIGSTEGTSADMDSDDLVPSIQDDILKDVENVLNSNKVDNLLTWL